MRKKEKAETTYMKWDLDAVKKRLTGAGWKYLDSINYEKTVYIGGIEFVAGTTLPEPGTEGEMSLFTRAPNAPVEHFRYESIGELADRDIAVYVRGNSNFRGFLKKCAAELDKLLKGE